MSKSRLFWGGCLVVLAFACKWAIGKENIRKKRVVIAYVGGYDGFISYDDEESVQYKCKYVEKNQLAGVMFWQYSSDPKGYLLEVIHKEFK